MIKLFLIIVLLSPATRAMCNGVIGSHLEWQAVPDTTGVYKIRLSLYLDERSSIIGEQRQNLYVYTANGQQTSGRRWTYFAFFVLLRTYSQKVDRDTLTCVGDLQRNVFLNVYEWTASINLHKYPSDNGYVIAWHPSSGRNGQDNNSLTRDGISEWVTTYIPPLQIGGNDVRNSSPTIRNLETFLVCKDQQTSIRLSATDVDGDDLKFKLSNPFCVKIIREPSGYEEIYGVEWVWANGYSDQNQVHGNPGLTINENTGMMTVKADEAGQYFIGISVDEYRNGQKIGSVSFYYTLTVVDCNEQQIFDKDIYQDTTSVKTLTICEGWEATLTSRQIFPDPQPEFQWTKNGKTIWGANSQSITIKEEGNYQLLTTKIDGCPDSFESETVHVSVISSGAEMDSIPPICDTTLPIALHATPPGGTFAGTGIVGTMFDPKIAGEGKHEIQYVIEGSEACSTSVAKREVIVSEAPVLDVVDILYTSRDKPISLGGTDSLNVAYRWTPPDYLNNVTYANPVSTPSAGIIYMVTATNAYGCVARREVQVKIIESILIPDAFTPNKDGINEVWELRGIEGYPKCRVTIYNRWGEVIFHSVGYQKPFDGTVSGALQMAGVYAYKIRLTENSPDLTGPLTLIR